MNKRVVWFLRRLSCAIGDHRWRWYGPVWRNGAQLPGGRFCFTCRSHVDEPEIAA